ncbi:MAG: hypothetical protein ACOYOJ_00950 [Alsobacter sp.]
MLSRTVVAAAFLFSGLAEMRADTILHCNFTLEMQSASALSMANKGDLSEYLIVISETKSLDIVFGSFKNLKTSFTGNIIGTANRKRATLIEHVIGDNAFVISIFFEQKETQGIPAVMHVHALGSYGITQHRGFCR